MPRWIAATAVAALLFYFGTGLDPVGWLVWIAPLPVLWYSERGSRAGAAMAGFAAYAGGDLSFWAYLRHALGVPVTAVLILLLVPAAVFAGAVLLWRALIRKERLWLAGLGLPAAWTAFEYFVYRSSPNGTAGNIAYSQMKFLPLMQIASVAGIWGISFAAVFIPAAIGTALWARRPKRQRAWFAVWMATAIALVLVLAVWRLARQPAEAERVTVGLAASDAPGFVFPETREEDRKVLEAYAGEVDVLARQGATIVVLPERIAVVEPEDRQAMTNLFAEAAARNRVMLVVGVAIPGAPRDHNVALVFSPEGKLLTTYEKRFLVPRLEDRFERGSEIAVLPYGGSPIGIEICKDMDFCGWSRRYGEAGAGLLLVPAWDFDRDRWLHSRMALLRGVEDGFGIARAARNGLLTVSDSRGRILAEARSSTGGFVTLTAQVGVAGERTLYRKYGDWFAWLCVAGLVLAVAGTFLPRKKT